MKSDLRLAGTDVKALGGNRGIALLILNLSKKWKSAMGFAPRPLHPRRKDLWYSMNKRLVWAPEAVGTLCSRDKFLYPAWNRTVNRPSRSPVRILATLGWFSVAGNNPTLDWRS